MSKKVFAVMLGAFSALLVSNQAFAASPAHGGGHGSRPTPVPLPPSKPIPKPLPNPKGFVFPYTCTDGVDDGDFVSASFIGGARFQPRSFFISAFVDDSIGDDGHDAAGGVWNGFVNQSFDTLSFDYTSDDPNKFWVAFWGYGPLNQPLGPIFYNENNRIDLGAAGNWPTITPGPNGTKHVEFSDLTTGLTNLQSILQFATVQYDFPAPAGGVGSTSGDFLLNGSIAPNQGVPPSSGSSIGCPDSRILFTP